MKLKQILIVPTQFTDIPAVDSFNEGVSWCAYNILVQQQKLVLETRVFLVHQLHLLKQARTVGERSQLIEQLLEQLQDADFTALGKAAHQKK